MHVLLVGLALTAGSFVAGAYYGRKLAATAYTDLEKALADVKAKYEALIADLKKKV